MKKRHTSTYTFGAGRRESHDSSRFYSRKLYGDMELPRPRPEDLVEDRPPAELLDKVLLGDAREVLKKMPNSSVHLVVTSPPYNVGKEYDKDLTLGEYLEFLREVAEQLYRVLVWGGRVCINVANLGRRPYIPLARYVGEIFEEVGFLMRGEIIWHKGGGVASSSTAWGTWRSAVNPTLRDIHEYILVFSKGTFERRGGESTISPQEFVEFTKSVWTFPPESAKKVGHPAPFPIELPYRCIQLYTFKKDVVLDPFAGSGTTCLAAAATGRHYVCIDIEEKYVKLAQERLHKTEKKITEWLSP
ncbi:MAG: DNA-methyltransferase [Pyrobaculum sp.]